MKRSTVLLIVAIPVALLGAERSLSYLRAGMAITKEEFNTRTPIRVHRARVEEELKGKFRELLDYREALAKCRRELTAQERVVEKRRQRLREISETAGAYDLEILEREKAYLGDDLRAVESRRERIRRLVTLIQARQSFLSRAQQKIGMLVERADVARLEASLWNNDSLATEPELPALDDIEAVVQGLEDNAAAVREMTEY